MRMKTRIKRIICLLTAAVMLTGTAGCAGVSGADEKLVATYTDVFDTVSTVTVYGVEKSAFDAGQEKLHDFLTGYHQLADIYHDYPGVVNLKTVNDRAGGDAVAADDRLLDLLEYGRDAYGFTDGRVNILFGAVLELWHDCRERGLASPAAAALPDRAALERAAEHISPDCLVIDREAGMVRLTDPDARIDVGAVAKGYVTELAAAYVRRELGWESALLNIGGNIRAVGEKPGHSPFRVGVQNPDTDSAEAYLTTVELTDTAAVTSGDYQRYYEVAGKRYAHIIDPDTLCPPEYVRSVTVICPDSGLADVLSTALFTLPAEKGEAMLRRFDGASAIWVLPDGQVRRSS